MAVVQERNPEMVDLLTPDFQRRYEPNFAWDNAIALHCALPGLRAFWPMSAVNYTVANRALDLGGGDYHLDDNNTPDFAYSDLIPYVSFDGVNQYLDRADGGAGNWADIIGTETYIATPQQGLSIGGWFYVQAFPALGAIIPLMTKWNDNAVNQRSYMLELSNSVGTNDFRFRVSGNGAAITLVTSSVAGVTGNWYHIVGTYDPAAQLAIYINGTKDTNAAAIPAALFDSTADFMIAYYNSGVASYFQGYSCFNWLAAMWYDDTQVLAVYEQTRALFGV